MSERSHADPPPAPKFERRVEIPRSQLVGLALLLALPVAALFGVFGLQPATARVVADPLELRVQYPGILRYKTSLPLEITVHNRGAAPLADVVLRLSRDYLTRFEVHELTPQPDQVTDAYVELKVDRLQPGESRVVTARLEGEVRGRHEGRVEATAGGRTTTAELSTMVLP